MDRLRVEDLAARADVSVDTIRFYQKRRLLPPPAREGRVAWYGPEHLERLARIRELQAHGLTLALIGRVVSGDLDATDAPLAIAVADADAREEFLSLAELAERAGVPEALLEAVAREGLARRRARTTAASATPTSDVAVVRAGLSLLEAGFPLPDLLALAREHNESTHDDRRAGRRAVRPHVRTPLRESDRSDREKADQLVAAFRVLLPAVTALVEHHFRRVLLAVAQEHLESVGEDARARGRERGGGAPARSRARFRRDRRRSRRRCRPPTRRRASSKTCSTGSRRATTCSTACSRSAWTWAGGAPRCVRCELPAGARVLDLACGTGDLCRGARRAPATARSASTSRPGMLAAARTDAPLVRADATRLPFPDGALDGLTCGFALRNFVDLAPVLAECARVLRPRGRHRARST